MERIKGAAKIEVARERRFTPSCATLRQWGGGFIGRPQVRRDRTLQSGNSRARFPP